MLQIILIAFLIFSAKTEVVKKSPSLIDSIIYSGISDNTAGDTIVNSDYENQAIYSDINDNVPSGTIVNSDYKNQAKHNDNVPSGTIVNSDYKNQAIYSDNNDKVASITMVSSDYENEAIKSKINNDYERLKSLMHYHMSKSEADALSGYTGPYHNMDDEDLRTNSATMYESWPHQYKQYEHTYNVHPEIVKDHYDTTYIKPVHEYVDEEMPNYHTTFRIPENGSPDMSPHTLPLVGKNPFISSVVNDYTNGDTSDDSLTFTNLDFWLPATTGGYHDFNIEDYKRDKRLGEYSPQDNYNDYYKDGAIESVTKKSYDKEHSFDKHEKGNKDKEIHKSEYEDGGKDYNEYRDIAESFGKQHSSGNQNKNSKYLLKKNAHQGENKKGFHRVYHKDEYQEDKEFFNNNENKIQAEENGGASDNFGHSTGILRSQAAAALGNKGNSYKKSGAVDRGKFEDNHKGHESSKGYDNTYNGYRHSPVLSAHSYDKYNDYHL